jgi:hypothetical protein
VQRKNTTELIGKAGTLFLFGDALEADAVADEGGTRQELAAAKPYLYKICPAPLLR